MFALDTQGLHPSTLLCLSALEALHTRLEVRRALDVGCGSGILSIVTARIWPAEVLAADISPLAVEDAEKAVAAQKLEKRIRALRSDGFSHPEIRKNAPYELIFCNLVADLLLSLAADVKRCLHKDGYAIFSGILAWRAEEIEQALSVLGLEIHEKFSDLPWLAYSIRHKNDT